MRNTTFIWLLISLGCLSPVSLRAQAGTQPDHPTAATLTPDETAVRNVVNDFYQAFGRKDLKALTAMWSSKAPDFEAFRKDADEFFGSHEKIDIRDLTVSRVEIRADSASLRVQMEMSAVDSSTGKASEGLGKMWKDLELVRDDGVWKISRNTDALSALGAKIVASSNDQERDEILRGNSELVSPGLILAIVQEGKGSSVSYDQAIASDDWAGKVARRIGDQIGVYETSTDAGMCLLMKGDYQQAIKKYQDSQAIAVKLGDSDRSAHALMLLGITSGQLGDYDAAFAFYDDAAKECLKAGDKGLLGAIFGNMGLGYKQRGNREKALEYYRKTLEIDQEVGDKRDLSITLANIGVVYGEQNDYAEAISWYQRAIEIFDERQDKRNKATTLMDVGIAYRKQNDFTRALDYLQRALAIQRELGLKPGEADCLRDIGSVYSAESKYVEAMDYFQKSLDLQESLGAKDGIARALDYLADTHFWLKQYPEAADFAQRSIAIAREIGEPETLWNSLTTAGMVYRAAGQTEKAETAFAEAISTIEKLRTETAGGEEQQQLFFKERMAPYQEMVSLLVSKGELEEALSQAEQVKARVLLDVLSGDSSRITKLMTAEERGREHQLEVNLSSSNKALEHNKASRKPSEEVAKAEKEVGEARIALTDFHTQLYTAHPELKVDRGGAEPIRAAEINRVGIAADEAIVEYAVGDQETLLFVLTRVTGSGDSAELREYSIPVHREDIDSKAEKFREELGERRLGFQKTARELYDLLLKPAEKQLRDKTQLIIIPDSGLWELPFQALQPSENHYLLERSAIAYAPSLTVLEYLLQRRDQGQTPATTPVTLLAMGNPAFGKQTVERVGHAYRSETLTPLPEAEKEVGILKQLYGPATSEVFVRSEAREDRFKAEAGKAKTLHLATHGFLNDSSPMYSHVVLSSDDQGSEDGLLEAWEIMQMDLKANLVVLSACETARGRIGAGEGVIGLSWAFFVAGTPTTVVSQWKVESESTTALMTAFHRTRQTELHSNSPFATARALRQAELQLLRTEQYAHPFYWAPFVVIGDPN